MGSSTMPFGCSPSWIAMVENPRPSLMHEAYPRRGSTVTLAARRQAFDEIRPGPGCEGETDGFAFVRPETLQGRRRGGAPGADRVRRRHEHLQRPRGVVRLPGWMEGAERPHGAGDAERLAPRRPGGRPPGPPPAGGLPRRGP